MTRYKVFDCVLRLLEQAMQSHVTSTGNNATGCAIRSFAGLAQSRFFFTDRHSIDPEPISVKSANANGMYSVSTVARL